MVGNPTTVCDNVIHNVVADVTSVGSSVQSIAGGLLSSVVGDVTSILANINGAGDGISTVVANANNAASNIFTAASGVAGGFVLTAVADVNSAASILGLAGTLANGLPAVLPTALAGIQTNVPITNSVVNNAGLPGAAGLKGRRRAVKRDIEVVTVVDVSLCAQNPDHETCGW